MINNQEREYLRDLAKQVKEISMNEIWCGKVDSWVKLNKLQSARPMVMAIITKELWQELITSQELLIEDPFYREFEYELKKRIYRWGRIRDDLIITENIYLPIKYRFSDWMPNRQRPFGRYESKSDNIVSAGTYHPCIIKYEDTRKMKYPELIDIDWVGTRKRVEQLQNVAGDILNIVEGEPFSSDSDSEVMGWGLSIIDILCELRGLQEVYLDMIENPQFVHDTMSFMLEGMIKYLGTIEKEGILRLNNNEFANEFTNTPLGSNGLGYSDELPPVDYSPNHIMLKDLWGYIQSQEFEFVSPEMHDDFVFRYQKPIAKKFPMIAYGCCEKYDDKYDYLLNAFPNLREVSVPLCADLGKASEKLKDKYVISWKPQCTLINSFNERKVRDYMEKGFETLKNCHVVCSMRDNLTLYGENDAIQKWTNLTMDIIKKNY